MSDAAVGGRLPTSLAWMLGGASGLGKFFPAGGAVKLCMRNFVLVNRTVRAAEK